MVDDEVTAPAASTRSIPPTSTWSITAGNNSNSGSNKISSSEAHPHPPDRSTLSSVNRPNPHSTLPPATKEIIPIISLRDSPHGCPIDRDGAMIRLQTRMMWMKKRCSIVHSSSSSSSRDNKHLIHSHLRRPPYPMQAVAMPVSLEMWRTYTRRIAHHHYFREPFHNSS